MRKPIGEENVSFRCSTCKQEVPILEHKGHVVICFCSRCNVYLEFSDKGVYLGSRHKPAALIVVEGGGKQE